MRLYYGDSYLREFAAEVVSVANGRAYLDRSAFYPESGGQPSDGGVIAGARVVDVIDEGDRVAHVIEGSLEVGPATASIDWPRRFDHMQQHTGQHMLSAVLDSEFGIPTVSFHLGRDACTIDLDTAAIGPGILADAELRANRWVCDNRPVTVSYHDSREDLGLRKLPNREGTIRVVTIDGLDRSACGGTHVRATGEVGPVLVRRVEKIRGIVRIEFLCGLRAVARARADYDLLSDTARQLSASIAQLPELVGAQAARVTESTKTVRKLGIELAQLRGADLVRSTQPSERGWKVHVRRIPSGGIEDDTRAEAQAFVAGGRAVYVAAAEESGAVLVAVSPDGPFKAGETMKALFARHGGRGGGNPQLAQGSVKGLSELFAELSSLW